VCDKGQRQTKGVKGGRKEAKKRAKEERIQDKRMKGAKAEGERKQKEKGSSKERWLHQKQRVRIKTCVLMRTSAMK